MRVDQRGKQIVRSRNGVKIAVKVEIDLGARLDLRKSAARRAAFHPEHGAERRLARSDDHFFADMRQALREADRRDRFALAGGGRGRCRDDNQLAAALESGIAKKFEVNFAAFRANGLEVLIGDFKFACYFANRKKFVGHESCGLLGAKENERRRKGYHNPRPKRERDGSARRYESLAFIDWTPSSASGCAS